MVSVIVGGLAAAAAFGRGGETTGSRGALQTVLEQPFGHVLLGIVAFGLGCYAAWQFSRASDGGRQRRRPNWNHLMTPLSTHTDSARGP
ncbi:MAG TPA: DUF1206 domain-containing protein [Tepidisphaeraceae bacterium]|nr:DUF1206 domain-containing protein [Tepidisphaeraceae bacterium]